MDANWLPDYEVLAAILAKVPLCMDKVFLQFVNRQWRDVLRRPEAHSLDTWSEDESMPPDPTAPQENGCTKISPAFIAALPGYKAGREGHVVASWEGWEHLIGLEALELWASDELDWEPCPIFASIKTLTIGGFDPPPCFSHFFPTLESVEFALEGFGSMCLPVLMADLETIPSIRNISLEVNGQTAALVGFGGPPDCRINYSVRLWPTSPNFWLSELPYGLPNHLQNLAYRFKELPEMENAKINLSVFAECVVLERLTLDFSHLEGSRDVRITGLGTLPASCQKVVIYSILGENDESGPPCVQPAVGWKVELVSLPFKYVVCSRVAGPVAEVGRFD